jgi:hypothetical protein
LRRITIALALAVLSLAQRPAMKPTAPDGRWWQNATREQRYQLTDAITSAYNGAARPSQPVADVISSLFRHWRESGRYKFGHADPSNEWDGNNLWPAFREMPAIVEGFLACQIGNGQRPPAVSPRTLVARVYKRYGLDIKKYPNTDLGPHARDKLGAVILRAEKGPIQP